MLPQMPRLLLATASVFALFASFYQLYRILSRKKKLTSQSTTRLLEADRKEAVVYLDGCRVDRQRTDGRFAGEYLPESQAKIPISDRGFNFGDGVFAALYVKDGVIELWDKHMEHLKAGTRYRRTKQNYPGC